MTFSSAFSIAPDSRESVAMVCSSSALILTSWALDGRSRVMRRQNQTMGLRITTIQRMGWATTGASRKAKLTPRVLGMISEKIRIVMVNMPENNTRFSSPKSLADAAPAIAAPTVLAIVFSVRMAVIGSLISARRSRRVLADA